MRHALRVALIWRQTVFSERTFAAPSERRRVRIGESLRSHFPLGGEGMPKRHDLFVRTDFGYRLDLLPGMGGKLVHGGLALELDEAGPRSREITPGDWGLVRWREVTLFFEFVRPDRRPPGRPSWRTLPRPLLACLVTSLVLQLAVVTLAQATSGERLAAPSRTGWVDAVMRIDPGDGAGAAEPIQPPVDVAP
jgi:hypothetical protein